MSTNNLVAWTLLSTALLTGAANAVTQPVVVNIAFDTPLTFSKGHDIDLGVVAAATAALYTVSPQGNVTTQGGHVLGGKQEGASFTIAGSSTQLVDISVTHYVPNAGVTPSAATCSYNGAQAAACNLVSQAAPGKGKTLLVGATVAVDGSQKIGTSVAPSFDVVVNYH
jgi:hypothetical protein